MGRSIGGPSGEDGGRQALAALSDYELRHLVAHLAQAARSGDVYRLLTLETPDGRNAWFEAKERSQGLGGYVADVEAAILLVRDAEQAAGTQGLAVGYRYALMLASVSALAGQVTPRFLAALVRHGIWTLDDALTAARRTSGARQRAEALIALAAYVPRSQRAGLVSDAVRAIADAKDHIPAYDAGRWTVEQLTAVVQLASGDVRDRLVANAVGVVVRMLRDADNPAFGDSLEILAPLLSPGQIAALVNAAVRSLKKPGIHPGAGGTLQALASYATGRTARRIARAAKGMDMDWRRAAIMARVAPNLPSWQRAGALRAAGEAAKTRNRGDINTEVLSAGQGELARQAIAAAESEVEPSWRIGSLLRLAPRVGGAARTRLYEALAAAARELGTSDDMDPFAAAELLGDIGDLPGPLRAVIIDAVLAAGRRLRVISDRIHALAAVAEHVEEPRRAEILAEAVSALAEMDEASRSFALDHLTPVLSRQLTIKALNVVRAAGDGRAVGEAVAALAPFRSYPPGSDLAAAARSAAAAVGFGPMKMNMLAAFAQRLTGQARAAVLAYALQLIFPDSGNDATDVADRLAIVAPLIAAEDNAMVARAWQRSLPIAARVYGPRWRAQQLIGLLAAQPRLGRAEDTRSLIVDGLKAAETWRLPYRAELLAALVPRVPAPARGQLLTDLAFADLMERTYRRPDDPALSGMALAIVASHLPDEDRHTLFQQPESVLGRDAGAHELRETLDEVRRAPTQSSVAGRYSAHAGRAEALIVKAEKAEGPARAEAVAEALIAAHGDPFWGIWQKLGPMLASLSDADLRAVIEQSLADRAAVDRKGLCSDIAHLAPMLARLGGRETADEITRALRDVERWWP